MLIFIRGSSSLQNDDTTPAGMWITHPDNIVTNNHVAGGTHFGYWYRMLEHPDGSSFTDEICPQKARMGKFYNNTAHSVGWYGLWVFEAYFPTVGGKCDSTLYEPAVFEKLTTWNSLRGGNMRVYYLLTLIDTRAYVTYLGLVKTGLLKINQISYSIEFHLSFLILYLA